MPIETHIFKNGFKLVYETATSDLPITSILAFVKCGSIDETHMYQKGMAHFIEHMCFKGTRKMDTAKEIMTTYDEIGAYLNANTNKEYTCYVVKCNNLYTANCIDVLSDMVLNSVLREKEINLERNVVQEETIRLDDDPEHHISKITNRLLYGDMQYSYPIDDLSYHTCSDPLPYRAVLEMYSSFYEPHNMGLSIVSSMPFRTIKKMVESTYFVRKSHLLQKHNELRVSFANPIKTYVMHTPADILFDIERKKGVSATHLNIAFRTCEHSHKDMYPLNLLATIIGGYMSSRMFMLLREKHGVTYKSTCDLTTYRPMGQFELYTMCDHTKMMRNSKNVGVLQLLLGLLNDLIKNGITQKELNEAKGNFKGKFILSMENIERQCQYNGIERIIYDNDSVPYQDIYKTYYECLTKKNVNDMISKYFRRENMVVCLFGEHVPEIELVKKYCTIFR
jgi:predicted Zn-dependent peptidase